MDQISAGAGIKASEEETTSARQKFIIQEVGRYKYLRDNLVELIALLNLSRVYVLIDEWTYLDKSGSYDIQPIFAELLNRTFGGIDNISIKFSSIRGSTNFYKKKNASLIGLQLGHDIFEVVDLDRFHSETNKNNSFFESLIYKKLLEVDDRVVCFSQVDEDSNPTYVPQDNLIRSLFKRDDIFDEIVEASGKVPRTFVELFKDVVRDFNFDISSKWDRLTVMNTIIRKSISMIFFLLLTAYGVQLHIRAGNRLFGK